VHQKATSTSCNNSMIMPLLFLLGLPMVVGIDLYIFGGPFGYFCSSLKGRHRSFSR